jgi:SAM-dependent methyltransferase
LNLTQQLVAAASAPYRAAGRFAYHFARGKLAADPIFEAILSRGLLAQRARILDLGCGQGLLAAWLLAAQGFARHENWPQAWAAPPQPLRFRGIELGRRDVERARVALGGRADITVGDVRTADFGSADSIVILDVLHYIEYADQLRVLERVRESLRVADGILLMRVGDAAGGAKFTWSTWVDRMVVLARGHRWRQLHCRSTGQWRDVLSMIGFDSESVPMSTGTRFANMLIIAKPR